MLSFFLIIAEPASRLKNKYKYAAGKQILVLNLFDLLLHIIPLYTITYNKTILKIY